VDIDGKRKESKRLQGIIKTLDDVFPFRNKPSVELLEVLEIGV